MHQESGRGLEWYPTIRVISVASCFASFETFSKRFGLSGLTALQLAALLAQPSSLNLLISVLGPFCPVTPEHMRMHFGFAPRRIQPAQSGEMTSTTFGRWRGFPSVLRVPIRSTSSACA